jgi:para-nitrobenzyl esterase
MPRSALVRSLLLAPLVLATSLTAASAEAAPRHLPSPTDHHSSRDPSVVRVSDGVLQGAVHDRGRLFAGIPFAAPPVGELRWKPPARVTPWTGTLNATWPRAQCAQAASSYALPAYTEDCLYLNVYTPPAGRRDRSKPVMVWIHGGAFQNGAGSSYNASALAAKGDVVVVTLNYRLGPFGWLVHPGLDAEAAQAGAGASGNYGLADQQAALRWVQRNIGAFGGDRRNVTIFGESAGGASVCSHLASPTARGLFARAIAQSGCSSLGRTREAAGAGGTAFAAAAGCPDAATAPACLRGKTPQQLLAAIGAAGSDLPWSPVPGTRILPRAVPDAFATGRFNRVPLLHGTNRDEGTFLVLAALGSLRLTPETYAAALANRYGDDAPAVAAAYPVGNYPTPTNALAATITDSVFACPAIDTDRQARRHVPVYAYEFNDRNAPPMLPADIPLGAYHAAELQYVFQYTPSLSLVPEFTPAQWALSEAMVTYWTDFAKRGTPNARGSARWPSARSEKLLSLDPAGLEPLSFTAFEADHQCALWRSLG